MTLLWALSAALSFGVADLCAREASQQESSLKTLLYLYLIGIPAAASFLIGRVVPWPAIFSWPGLAGVAVGLIIAAGTVFLYRALVAGPLLIVSPIASSFAVVTFVLSLLSGERPTNLQLVGLVVTLAGVIFASISTSHTAPAADTTTPGVGRRSWISAGVIFAIGTAVLHGIGFWLLRFIVPALGSETTVLVMRVATLPFLLGLFWVRGIPVRLGHVSSLKWLIPVGVLDTAASWFYNLAVASGLTSIASVVTSLYSVVTVVLGYLIWQERITRVQQTGVAITLVGIALVSV